MKILDYQSLFVMQKTLETIASKTCLSGWRFDVPQSIICGSLIGISKGWPLLKAYSVYIGGSSYTDPLMITMTILCFQLHLFLCLCSQLLQNERTHLHKIFMRVGPNQKEKGLH